MCSYLRSHRRPKTCLGHRQLSLRHRPPLRQVILQVSGDVIAGVSVFKCWEKVIANSARTHTHILTPMQQLPIKHRTAKNNKKVNRKVAELNGHFNVSPFKSPYIMFIMLCREAMCAFKCTGPDCSPLWHQRPEKPVGQSHLLGPTHFPPFRHFLSHLSARMITSMYFTKIKREKKQT